MKRVICGGQPDGSSTVIGVEELVDRFEERVARGMRLRVRELWATEGPSLATIDRSARVGDAAQVSVGATRFRLVTYPGVERGSPVAMHLHRTDTIDYVLVLEGAIDLVMEDGSEAALVPGDCVVQLGGVHLWRLRTAEATTLAFVMIGAG